MAAFRLRLELRDTDSPVWREVLVPDRASFADLHSIVQSVMQWGDFEYHSFYIGYDFDSDGSEDRFHAISGFYGRDIVYLYEPDAGWEVDITWLGRTDDDLGYTPYISDWEGNAPPEGCYDMDDFRRFLKAVADPTGPDFEEYGAMAEGWEFDPDAVANSLQTWGVQGVVSKDAVPLDPMVRMTMVMMTASMSGLPVVFDRTDKVTRFVADPDEVDGDIPESVTPAQVGEDPGRYLWVLSDPYSAFTELVDGFSLAVEGRGLSGRDPEAVLDKLIRNPDDEEYWEAYAVAYMSDTSFGWARDNGYYFSLPGGSEEGETF